MSAIIRLLVRGNLVTSSPVRIIYFLSIRPIKDTVVVLICESNVIVSVIVCCEFWKQRRVAEFWTERLYQIYFKYQLVRHAVFRADRLHCLLSIFWPVNLKITRVMFEWISAIVCCLGFTFLTLKIPNFSSCLNETSSKWLAWRYIELTRCRMKPYFWFRHHYFLSNHLPSRFVDQGQKYVR